MSRGFPSMTALLALLAIAGYQNRDKISDALQGLKNRSPSPYGNPREGLDGILDGLGGLLGGATGGGLAGGLGDLMDTFRRSGQAETADSWITPGVPTKGLRPDEVEQAIGADNLDELSRRTGLTRDDLLQRLSKAIPETVDRMTPDGRCPSED